MKQEIRKQLELDEDRRKQIYKDTKGYWTIGIGRLVDPRVKGSGLRDDEINYMFNNDVDDRIDALTRALPWFQNLDDARKGVLINMAFQLGTVGLLGFKETLALVRRGEYALAADAMLISKWAREDTPARAKRMSEQMRTGIWQFNE
jgi:lysozyme